MFIITIIIIITVTYKAPSQGLSGIHTKNTNTNTVIR